MTEIDQTVAKRRWKTFHSDTPKAAELRAANDSIFNKLFPDGHDTSIRPIVLQGLTVPLRQRLRELMTHDLGKLSPEAIQLLYEYGIDYTPVRWGRGPYEQSLQPVWGGCYANSYFVTKTSEATLGEQMDYVEGIVHGFMGGLNAIVHAWNTRATDNRRAYDWSLYPSCHWYRYFGVPFTLEEYQEILTDSGIKRDYISLFHKGHFKYTRGPLRRVLERRTIETPGPANTDRQLQIAD